MFVLIFYSTATRILSYRNPVHRLRPTFVAILKTISQPPYVLFHWFEEDKQAAGPQCDVLGAPLESGHNLFLDLQNAYK